MRGRAYLAKLCVQPCCGGSALHRSQTLLLLELADAQPVHMQLNMLQDMQCCRVAHDILAWNNCLGLGRGEGGGGGGKVGTLNRS